MIGKKSRIVNKIRKSQPGSRTTNDVMTEYRDALGAAMVLLIELKQFEGIDPGYVTPFMESVNRPWVKLDIIPRFTPSGQRLLIRYISTRKQPELKSQQNFK